MHLQVVGLRLEGNLVLIMCFHMHRKQF